MADSKAAEQHEAPAEPSTSAVVAPPSTVRATETDVPIMLPATTTDAFRSSDSSTLAPRLLSLVVRHPDGKQKTEVESISDTATIADLLELIGALSPWFDELYM